MRDLTPWMYRGLWILPADRNSSGIRWTVWLEKDGLRLRAVTKDGMRALIREHLDK